jgi:hypothetical protein
MHHDVIHIIITIQIKVIYSGIFIIQTPFETLQCLRLLEQFHHRVKVQVIAREAQVFILIRSSADRGSEESHQRDD